MEEREEEKGKGSERWRAATGNLSEMAANLDSLQKLLVKKAVYIDQETFAKASLSSKQTRTIKVRAHIKLFQKFSSRFYSLISSILPSGFVNVRISGPIELNELCLLTEFGGLC